jgi:catechol 2,3-dioxygenase-like lactoylglutathione lyase family enzyme
MLDHIGFPVRDFASAKAFYTEALAPLGYGLVMEVTPEMSGGSSHAGFGPPHRPHFWIGNAAGPLAGNLHVAFAAKERQAVEAFYKAAIAAGARDNGAPGLRPHYHPDYYGAFVISPDGHNIEAVCHAPG